MATLHNGGYKYAQERRTPRVNRNVNCWNLGDNDVFMEIHPLKQKFHSVGDIDSRGSSGCVAVGGIEETSVPSSQFCCEAKMALKNKVY